MPMHLHEPGSRNTEKADVFPLESGWYIVNPASNFWVGPYVSRKAAIAPEAAGSIDLHDHERIVYVD